MANYPDRCQHLKINGTQCGSPALRRNRFCFFHKRFQDERIRLSADRARRGVATFVLPVLEDANSIQIALMQVMRLLLSQQIDPKTASLLLYALQTASTNLRMTKFDPRRHDVVLDPRTVGDTPLNSNIWDDHDFEDEDEDESETAAEAEVREREERENRLREWAARHPDWKLVRVNGRLTVSRIDPPPTLKKPASSSTPEEIRAQISDMVREDLLPALDKKFGPGNQHDKQPEKKAT
jgi:hypothetical protein